MEVKADDVLEGGGAGFRPCWSIFFTQRTYHPASRLEGIDDRPERPDQTGPSTYVLIERSNVQKAGA